MRIIAKKHLIAYWTRRPETELSLKTWYLDANHATWRTPQAIKSHYPSASFIGNNRVVFNIKGNQHRLVVATAFEFNALYI